VADRIRTGDRLDHNQELYQLSYSHHAAFNLALLLEAMRRRQGIALLGPRAWPATATGAQARGAAAIGALAVGAAAVGGFAIGRLAVGRLAIKQAKIGRLQVDELEVGRLQVREGLLRD
jgi:hypothetical protein